MKSTPLLFMRKISLMLLIFSTLLLHTNYSKAQVNQKDSLFLVAMYTAYYGENWTRSDNWLTGNVETWYGISLNEAGTRVTKVELPENNIEAKFPQTITDRTWLAAYFADLLVSDIVRFIRLARIIDNIYGETGTSLGELTLINLSRNNISGYIPVEISDSKNLQRIDLSYNSLSNNIPAQIGDLAKIDHLNLRNNQFTGSIPDNLFNASNLQYLDLQHNQLEGNIPVTIGNLSELKHLDLQNNLLAGALPEQLWDLWKLEHLSLRRNNYSGQLSDKVSQLTQIKFFNISANQFSGTIPDAFANLTMLEQLLLHQNGFTGDVPASIGEIPYLMNLDISENKLINLPKLSNVWNAFVCKLNYFTFEDFEKNLELQKKLELNGTYAISPQYEFGEEREYTGVVNTSFSITIPCGGKYNNYSWIHNDGPHSGPFKSDTLKFLPLKWSDAGEYYVKVTNDSVASYLVLESKITIINIENNCLYEDSLRLVEFYHATGGPSWTRSDNWLTGPVNSWLGISLSTDGCNVTQIQLSDNNLTGNIPLVLSNLTELVSLELQENQLTGAIPNEINQLKKLKNLNLMENSLSGEIPAGILQCTDLESIQLGYNSISGTIPNAIGNLQKLQTFSVTHNQLGGIIPASLYTIKSLTSLDITANDFYGNIAPQIGNLSNLEMLQISENQFTGIIPDEIGNLSQLQLFSLYDNQFSSALPAGIATLSKLEELIFHHNLFDDIPELANVLSQVYCSSNHLTFEDFERNLNQINSSTIIFDYIPQLKFERDTTIYITENNPLTLSRLCGGSANHYTWWKNGTSISNDSPSLLFNPVQLTDAGDYWVTVTSDLVPDLVLESEKIHLVVEENCLIADSTVLVDLYNATGGTNWIRTDNWLNGPVSSWFGIESLSENGCNITEINLNSNHLNGNLPTAIGKLLELEKLDLSNNLLRGLLPQNLGKLGKLNTFDVAHNLLLFGDIDAAEIDIQRTSFIYAPQDTILALSEIYEQRAITITDDNFTGNVYHWYHNDKLANTGTNFLEISETGSYYCLVTNPAFGELTLYSDTLLIEKILPFLDNVEPVNLVILDGLHSPEFFITGIELYPDNHLVVFNRWGNKVYEKSGYNNELDFSIYPAGVYYYLLNYTKPEGAKQIKSFVNVVKE